MASMLPCVCSVIKTLRSDNGDVHENVAERETSHSLKLLRDYPKSPFYFRLEVNRGDRARVQTEMVEFIALPFPFSSKLKLWPFYVVVVKGR